MRTPKELPTEIVRELFDYDPVTGQVTWRRPPAPNVKVGDRVGKLLSSGYIGVRCNALGYVYVHRIAWTHARGTIPADMVLDHIDGDRANNALSNLRLASNFQNACNTTVSIRSKTGLKGVYCNRRGAARPWKSQIQVAKKAIYLGSFATAEEASAAYCAAAKIHFGEFARLA